MVKCNIAACLQQMQAAAPALLHCLFCAVLICGGPTQARFPSVFTASNAQVRYIGVSNETSWGVCQFDAAAKAHGLPKVLILMAIDVDVGVVSSPLELRSSCPAARHVFRIMMACMVCDGQVQTIQNSYSLLYRGAFETDLAETCAPHNANVSLLVRHLALTTVDTCLDVQFLCFACDLIETGILSA